MKTLSKIFLVAICLVSFGLTIKAQSWSINGSNLYANPTSTNVGIGTSAPSSKLHLNASSGQNGLRLQIAGYSKFTVASNGGTSIGSYQDTPPTDGLYVYGAVGIGISDPSEKLHIDGSVRGSQSGALRVSTGYGYVDLGPKNTSWCHFYTDRERYYFDKEIRVDQGLIGSHNENLQLRTSGTTRMTIDNSNGNVHIGGYASWARGKLVIWGEGDPANSESIQQPLILWGSDQALYMGVNTSKRVSYIQSVDIWTGASTLALNARGGSVAIGTTDATGYKLAVAGNMIAERVYCKLQSNWPDFVFTENHELKSLTEVENFLNENKHLPGIPSANDVAENGIDLGNMNILLLQKIEELTLYIIEQNKQIKNMQVQIESLQE